MTDPIRILLWGNPEPPEMSAVALHLLALQVVIVPCPTIFGIERAAIPAGGDPDLVVALQSWPDEFPRDVVEQAIARFPLARWVCCHGAWCASDGRSRDIWPSGTRIAAASAPRRIARQLAVIRGEFAPLALTASRDEVFAFDLPGVESHESIASRLDTRPRAIPA